MAYGEILFPTDGSDGSWEALEHALDLASTYSARIHAIYVIDTSYPYGEFDGVAVTWDSVIEQFREEGTRVVNAVVDAAADYDVTVEPVVREGDVVDRTILEYVADADIDLIVMGTHGRRGLNRLLLGSVTEQVVRQASVPVLTVKMSKQPPVETEEPIDDRGG